MRRFRTRRRLKRETALSFWSHLRTGGWGKEPPGGLGKLGGGICSASKGTRRRCWWGLVGRQRLFESSPGSGLPAALKSPRFPLFSSCSLRSRATASPQTLPCPWIDSPSYLGKAGGAGTARVVFWRPKTPLATARFPLAPRGTGWKLLLHPRSRLLQLLQTSFWSSFPPPRRVLEVHPRFLGFQHETRLFREKKYC